MHPATRGVQVAEGFFSGPGRRAWRVGNAERCAARNPTGCLPPRRSPGAGTVAKSSARKAVTPQRSTATRLANTPSGPRRGLTTPPRPYPRVDRHIMNRASESLLRRGGPPCSAVMCPAPPTSLFRGLGHHTAMIILFAQYIKCFCRRPGMMAPRWPCCAVVFVIVDALGVF